MMPHQNDFLRGILYLLISALCFFIADRAWSAEIEEDAPVTLYAQDIPSAELVGLLYREIFRKPFVTAPNVQADKSKVSVHIAGSQASAIVQASDYLAALGFVIKAGEGVDRVELPEAVKADPPPVVVSYAYRPRFRDAESLSAALRPLFPEAKFSGEEQQGDKGASSGVLVVRGVSADVTAIQRVLPSLDAAVSDLVIKAAVFEVGTNIEDGSAFRLALSLLKGQVDLAVGQPGSSLDTLGSFLSVKSSSVEAVVSALSTDTRFNLVTSPSVRARSGSQSSFTVGSSVPVLGSVSYPEGGGSTPVQSVDYRDAGVIFTVRPVIHERVINLDLHQEISDFVATTTGVNNTPTLTRRSLDSSLTLTNGDVVILGGLTKTKDEDAKEGFSFLPDFARAKRKTTSRSDLLLILQVLKLDTGDTVGNWARSQAQVPVPLPRPSVAPVAGLY